MMVMVTRRRRRRMMMIIEMRREHTKMEKEKWQTDKRCSAVALRSKRELSKL